MAKLRRIARTGFIYMFVIAWLATGWPVLWDNPQLPPYVGKAAAATETFTTSGSWTAPADVTSVTVEAWGGGGAGGGRGNSNGQSGGGGGGAYASRTISVVPGNIYTYTVGEAVAGSTGNGSNGNPTLWGNGTMIKAAGGQGGSTSNTRGLGGAVADSAGTIIFKGGDGGNSTATMSGGGGGGAGTTGAGGNATGSTAGTGTSFGGGNGGAGVTDADGNDGVAAGGGGSGARRAKGNRSGGGGAAGQIRITYAVVSVTISDGNISYGSVVTGTSQDTTSGGINDTQAATNAGDSALDFNIKGQNSAQWTLAGAAGTNQYVHAFCTTGSGSPDPCDSAPVWTSLTTSYQSLATNIPASGSQRFDLRYSAPITSTTSNQQSVDVTIQAVQH